MADGVAQGEIFPEGEDGDESHGESNDGGGREEDEGDDDGNENEGGEDTFSGHGEEG